MSVVEEKKNVKTSSVVAYTLVVHVVVLCLKMSPMETSTKQSTFSGSALPPPTVTLTVHGMMVF